MTVEFSDVGRLPLPGDNVAIAIRRLEAGTTIKFGDGGFRLDHTVMEGHRFAIKRIEEGDFLLSWELPFGLALQAIEPGSYVCNEGILTGLGMRNLDFELPAEPNFQDRIQPYTVDALSFQPGVQVQPVEQARTFLGYDRGPERGVGTRNYIVVMGTSSRASSFARLLAERMSEAAADSAYVDGIVAVAHTEGGGDRAPNNREEVLRTLSGFMVHSNVGAVLAVDAGNEAVNNTLLKEYLESNDYPLDQVVHHFSSLDGNLEQQLSETASRLDNWLEGMERFERKEHSVAHLKLALQCGGSDAFSGISGNPLASWAARELIRSGGAANLAETDELIGAEPYVLQNVKDLETAQTFLSVIERFKERVAWHGASAEGNPSGGNKYRGLYNINLKSIGAALKRHPDVRLDYTIDYGERIAEPGYYFMDSPGNDLESVAGQVASGCNLIYFVTGNGSITNFPFVPTIKIVTTTERYQLLSEEMDINAGAYLDGQAMDELGAALFERTLEVASGERSRGEQAGHSQVSIWRNWQQTDGSNLKTLREAPVPTGDPVAVQEESGPEREFQVFHTGSGHATQCYGMIMPTSLCAGQIARMSAERLNAQQVGKDQGINRFVALVHTEGCGLTSTGATEHMQLRTVIGYLTHPLAQRVLLLEHGCEKTHNDFYRKQVEEMGLDADHFGWASIQLDGGIEQVLGRVEDWFTRSLDGACAPDLEDVGLEALHIAMHTTGPVAPEVATYMAQLSRWIVTGGGTVVIPANAALLEIPEFASTALESAVTEPTLAYGQRPETTGFYVMETPTDHWVETLTGLGATGIEMVLVHSAERLLQGHPLVAVLQVASEDGVVASFGDDLDLALSGDAGEWSEKALDLLIATASRQHVARVFERGEYGFSTVAGTAGGLYLILPSPRSGPPPRTFSSACADPSAW